MKVWIFLFLGILCAGLIVYAARVQYSECDTPLPYTIGAIDPRFDLSSQDAASDIQTATAVWSAAEGKPLFTPSVKATLTVNFVYDQRQALDTQINQLNSKLKENNDTLQQQIDAYNAQSAAFAKRLNDLNATIDKYNQEGGAPPEVYDALSKQQTQLKTEGDSLNARARELKLSTHDYNAGVYTLNQDIGQLNTALAKKPEEGIFNGGDNTITLYFAGNRQELLHTLTHEFGHALGMEHVRDANAIMYPYSTESLKVTMQDSQQLAYVCREQSAVMHWAQLFDIWVLKQLQSRGLLHTS